MVPVTYVQRNVASTSYRLQYPALRGLTYVVRYSSHRQQLIIVHGGSVVEKSWAIGLCGFVAFFLDCSGNIVGAIEGSCIICWSNADY